MNDRVVSVTIIGARGRMGKALIGAVMQSDNLTLVGAVENSDTPGLGEDAGRLCGMPPCGVLVSDELHPPRGSVVVDFSLPNATAANVEQCCEAGVPLVLGTTGIDEKTQALVSEAAKRIPIVWAANFSVGITLLTRLTEIATRALGSNWETEIVELHHRHKRDAPSGTALRLGKAIADATGKNFEQSLRRRVEPAESGRGRDEIGIVALRGGDSAGEHTVMLLGEGERIELTHRAGDRVIFALGALRAARWVLQREPGMYDMADVLGLNQLG